MSSATPPAAASAPMRASFFGGVFGGSIMSGDVFAMPDTVSTTRGSVSGVTGGCFSEALAVELGAALPGDVGFGPELGLVEATPSEAPDLSAAAATAPGSDGFGASIAGSMTGATVREGGFGIAGDAAPGSEGFA